MMRSFDGMPTAQSLSATATARAEEQYLVGGLVGQSIW